MQVLVQWAWGSTWHANNLPGNDDAEVPIDIWDIGDLRRGREYRIKKTEETCGQKESHSGNGSHCEMFWCGVCRDPLRQLYGR